MLRQRRTFSVTQEDIEKTQVETNLGLLRCETVQSLNIWMSEGLKLTCATSAAALEQMSVVSIKSKEYYSLTSNWSAVVYTLCQEY